MVRREMGRLRRQLPQRRRIARSGPTTRRSGPTDVDADPDNYFLVNERAHAEATARKRLRGRTAERLRLPPSAIGQQRLDQQTRAIYQAHSVAGEWTGKLLAYRLNLDGTVGELRWDAASLIPAPDSRVIFTRDGAVPGTKGGIPFRWSDLGTAQQTALNQRPDGTVDTFGDERVAWLRGDPAQEQESGGFLRNRSVVLGDIINSDPQFVGGLNFGYETLPVGTPGRNTYTVFRRSKVSTLTGAPLQPMMYVGANDGMLHAFDATTGAEHFAYVPST